MQNMSNKRTICKYTSYANYDYKLFSYSKINFRSSRIFLVGLDGSSSESSSISPAACCGASCASGGAASRGADAGSCPRRTTPRNVALSSVYIVQLAPASVSWPLLDVTGARLCQRRWIVKKDLLQVACRNLKTLIRDQSP
jgi:hypothetical protein